MSTPIKFFSGMSGYVLFNCCCGREVCTAVVTSVTVGRLFPLILNMEFQCSQCPELTSAPSTLVVQPPGAAKSTNYSVHVSVLVDAHT